MASYEYTSKKELSMPHICCWMASSKELTIAKRTAEFRKSIELPPKSSPTSSVG